VKALAHVRGLAARLAMPRLHASWAEACARAGAYEDDLVNRFRVDRHRLRQPDGSLLRNSVMAIVSRLLPTDATIVDFGGAAGDLGIELLNAHPGMTYTVVENETLVGLMAETSEPVKFVSETPQSCDLFFSSGTLQYMEDPFGVLRQGFESARLMVVLVRNSFASSEMYHVQSSWLFDNGAGPVPAGYDNRKITYPHRTLRMQAVIDLASQCGFACRASLEEHSGALYGAEGRQLVFERL
jgi:putative methyltransferase (TIGR04325 family)